MERIDLKIKEPTPEEKERIDEVVKPFSYVSAAISENFNEHIKPFSDELLKKLEESVKQWMYEYGAEYETIQRCYGAYFKKEGIVIPASAHCLLMWLWFK